MDRSLFQIRRHRVIILYVRLQKLLIGAEMNYFPKIIAIDSQLFDEYRALESLTKKGRCDILKTPCKI